MNQGDKPDLLIFHGPSCLDGFASTWALKQKWPDVAVFEGVYGQDPPDCSDLRVLIADFSYSEETMRGICAAARTVTVLDHHASSAQMFKTLFEEGLIAGEHDQSRSGAALTWEYVWGNRHHPLLISHVQDRDLWKFEMPQTREICACLASVGQDLDTWTGIARALEGGRRHEVVNDGAAIIRQRDFDMVALMEAGRRMMIIGGERVPVVNAPYFWASDIGNAMSVGQPFAATYMDLPHGRQFSLRSQQDGMEVHKIAEEYGGGGHPHAAGFTAPTGWEGDIDQDETLEVIQLKAGGGVRVQEG